MTRWTVSTSLLAELDAMAARRQYSDEITEREDAFLLDPGLGPAMYITQDGRVLIDSRGWDDSGIHEADDGEAIAAFVVGAKKTGVSALLELLPKRPDGAIDCATCSSGRWLRIGIDVATGKPGQVLCFTCGGRGWAPTVA